MSTKPKTEASRELLEDFNGIGIDIGRQTFAERLATIETAAVDAYLQSDEFENLLPRLLMDYEYGGGSWANYSNEGGRRPYIEEAKAIAKAIRDSRQ